MIKIGFHTDAFNSSYWNFEQCLQWAQKNDVHFIECGTIDGVSWAHGLGYQPHIALWEEPILLRRKLEKYDVQIANLDAAFPLSSPEGATLGVQYVINTIRYAKLVGCPRVDTTDGLSKHPYLKDSEALAFMKSNYREILKVAEAHKIVIDIEPHGYYTTKPEFMEKMLGFFDSPYLRMNMDTGNTYIAGLSPVAFLERFKSKVGHVHIKDVSESLAAASRGKESGIAVSHCSIGDGVNALNIKKCVDILVDIDYDGVVCMECEGAGGPMIEKSLAWVREVVSEANRKMATKS